MVYSLLTLAKTDLQVEVREDSVPAAAVSDAAVPVAALPIPTSGVPNLLVELSRKG